MLKERVLALRKACGFTQAALAERAGLRRTEINRIENGKNQASSHPVRTALAKGFDLSLKDLDAYLAGELPIRDALARMGEVSAPPPPVMASSTTPRFDAAVKLLDDEVAPAIVREVRAEVERSGDEARTIFGWAVELTNAQKKHAEKLAAAARVGPKPTKKIA